MQRGHALFALREPHAWRRVLVLAAHPDDESLAAGGLLQRAVALGATVHVVFATDGENNPWPQRVLERRWRIGPRERARWGARRRAEARAALGTLGVPLACATFLHLPDQGLTPLLLQADGRATGLLADAVAAVRPTLLVAPSGSDRHPDHAALAVLLRLALGRLGPRAPRATELAYVVHGDTPTPRHVELALTPEEQSRKQAAIRCHASQIALSRGRFLACARPTEVFLDPARHADVRHRVRRVVRCGDGLLFVLAPGRGAEAAVPATLAVVAMGPGCHVVSRSVPVAPATRVVRLSLPTRVVQVWARLERPRLFFDRAGWRALSVSGSPPGDVVDERVPAIHAVPRAAR